MNAEILLVELPLAALDSGIVCWIFAALTQTTRALRLRRLNILNIIRIFYIELTYVQIIFYLKECGETPIIYSFH